MQRSKSIQDVKNWRLLSIDATLEATFLSRPKYIGKTITILSLKWPL